MNRLETNDQSATYYVTFFDKIIRYLEGTGNGIAPFCDDCENELGNLIVNLLIEGN